MSATLVKDIPPVRNRPGKIPLPTSAGVRTAKRFNFRRHYADNNFADLLPHKLTKGLTGL
jgi:hypothetical protein